MKERNEGLSEASTGSTGDGVGEVSLTAGAAVVGDVETGEAVVGAEDSGALVVGAEVVGVDVVGAAVMGEAVAGTGIKLGADAIGAVVSVTAVSFAFSLANATSFVRLPSNSTPPEFTSNPRFRCDGCLGLSR